MAYRNGLQHELIGKNMTNNIFECDIEMSGCPAAAVSTKNEIGKKQAKFVNTRTAIRFATTVSAVAVVPWYALDSYTITN